MKIMKITRWADSSSDQIFREAAGKDQTQPGGSLGIRHPFLEGGKGLAPINTL